MNEGDGAGDCALAIRPPKKPVIHRTKMKDAMVFDIKDASIQSGDEPDTANINIGAGSSSARSEMLVAIRRILFLEAPKLLTVGRCIAELPVFLLAFFYQHFAPHGAKTCSGLKAYVFPPALRFRPRTSG